MAVRKSSRSIPSAPTLLVTIDDVRHGKPDPEGYLLAARGLARGTISGLGGMAGRTTEVLRDLDLLKPAAELGMTTVLVGSHAAASTAWTPHSSVWIRSSHIRSRGRPSGRSSLASRSVSAASTSAFNRALDSAASKAGTDLATVWVTGKKPTTVLAGAGTGAGSTGSTGSWPFAR